MRPRRWATSIGCSPTSVRWRAVAIIMRSWRATDTWTTPRPRRPGTPPTSSTRSAARSACSGTRIRSSATCCAAPSWRPRRAAVFHCAIGWYFQRKKKWTKALRWYDRALAVVPDLPPLPVPARLLPREAASAAGSGRGAHPGARRLGSGRHEQRTRGRGVQVQVLFHLSRDAPRPGRLRRRRDRARRMPCPRRRHRSAGHPRPSTCWPAGRSCRSARATTGRARPLRGGARDRSDVELRLGAARPGPRAARRRRRGRGRLPPGGRRCRAEPSPYLSLGRFHLHVTRNYGGGGERARRWRYVELRERRAARAARARPPAARLRARARRATSRWTQALACRRESGFAEGLTARGRAGRAARPPGGRRRHLGSSPRLAPADTDGSLRQRADELERTPRRRRAARRTRPCPTALALLSDVALDIRGRDRVIGIVDRFFAEKGFGFVRYGEGQPIFFHVTQFPDGVTRIEPGTSRELHRRPQPEEGEAAGRGRPASPTSARPGTSARAWPVRPRRSRRGGAST